MNPTYEDLEEALGSPTYTIHDDCGVWPDGSDMEDEMNQDPWDRLQLGWLLEHCAAKRIHLDTWVHLEYDRDLESWSLVFLEDSGHFDGLWMFCEDVDSSYEKILQVAEMPRVVPLGPGVKPTHNNANFVRVGCSWYERRRVGSTYGFFRLMPPDTPSHSRLWTYPFAIRLQDADLEVLAHHWKAKRIVGYTIPPLRVFTVKYLQANP